MALMKHSSSDPLNSTISSIITRTMPGYYSILLTALFLFHHSMLCCFLNDDCNAFLNHFVNKVLDLTSKISLNSSTYEDSLQCPESFTYFYLITLNDLTIISMMKASSCMLEILPPSELFGTLTRIEPSLLSISNSSLRQGCVPSCLKHSAVTLY